MPPLKKLIKRIIREGSSFIPDRFPPQTQFLTLPDAHVFFGYYDLQPWSSDQRHILFMSVKMQNVSPHSSSSPLLDLHCMDTHLSECTSFAQTSTWNWQQGCRLQWFGADKALYNHLVDGRYGAIVRNVKTGEIVQRFSAPLYDISCDRKWGLSLDFSRLHVHRRGYGYHQCPVISEKNTPKDDGIYLANLSNDTVKLIVPLETLAQIDPRPDMVDAAHYFNHLKFNPEGTRFLAFHVWVNAHGKRDGRLFTADSDGGNIRILAEDITPSHYAWIDHHHILLTGKLRGIGERYVILQDCDNAPYSVWDVPFLYKDGHPSCIDKHNIISDTYPDIQGFQTLFSVENGEQKILASSHFPFHYQGEMRCDMHPRLSPNKNTICIDFVKSGRRAMALIPFVRVSSP